MKFLKFEHGFLVLQDDDGATFAARLAAITDMREVSGEVGFYSANGAAIRVTGVTGEKLRDAIWRDANEITHQLIELREELNQAGNGVVHAISVAAGT